MATIKVLKQEQEIQSTPVIESSGSPIFAGSKMASMALCHQFLRRSWNEEQNRQLIGWYFGGLDDSEIAKQFGDKSLDSVKRQRILITGTGLGKDLPAHPYYTELMEASMNWKTPHPI
jgi:hypothetical protein